MENENDTNSKGLSKNFWIIIGVLLLIVIVVVAVILTSDSYEADPVVKAPSQDTSEPQAGDPGFELGELEGEEKDFSDIGATKGPSGNYIIDDQVVDREGQPVRMDVEPSAPNAPQQSNVIERDQISEGVIQLEISAEGFEPNEFRVQAGQLVAISLSQVDGRTHSFRFYDENLNAVGIGVGPGDPTRMTEFNAPLEPGEYSFYCNSRGHADRGEVGVMIVE